MIDLVGFGVGVATAIQYIESFPERCYKAMLLPIMMEDKRTGKTEPRGVNIFGQCLCY